MRPEGPTAIPREPSHYAKSLFFDPLTLDATTLRFLIARFGADQVMMGSDYPFDMGASDPIASIAEANLRAEESAPVEGETAKSFFRIVGPCGCVTNEQSPNID